MLPLSDWKVKSFQCIRVVELALMDRLAIMHFIVFKFGLKLARFPLKIPLFPNILKTFIRHELRMKRKRRGNSSVHKHLKIK